MSHEGSWKFDFGNLKYVNAIYSSSFPDGADGGNSGGFVFESNGVKYNQKMQSTN